MELVRIPTGGWVLACDGGKAQILRNDGDTHAIRLVAVEVFEQHLPAAHDMGTDRPGRVYQSQGDARSSTEQTDPHEAGEIAFLSHTIEALDQLVRTHAVKSLVVVAPPDCLGILRKHFTPGLRAIISHEIGKDLAHFATEDIARHLADAQ